MAPRWLGMALCAVAASCGTSPAFEPIMVEPAPEPEGYWTPPLDDPAIPFALGQTWIGRYTCAQGETRLALHVIDIDGPYVRALFEFEHEPTEAKGLFELLGAWVPDDRHLDLEPVRWHRQPEGYVTVAMSGHVTLSGRKYMGTVRGPGCTHFGLELVR